MQLFAATYARVMEVSRHRSAVYYLWAIAFLESFILPFPPPDVLLAPMSVAKPERAMRYATQTLIFSVVGGLAGYLIGFFLFELAQPYIEQWGYQERMARVMVWFDAWGFWAVLVAGFSPVPYKIFTIAAGVLHLALIPFILASLVGRGLRFYLVAWFLSRYGPSIEARLIQYIERIGWAVVILLGAAIALRLVMNGG